LFYLTLRDFEPPRPVGAIRWGWGSRLAGHGCIIAPSSALAAGKGLTDWLIIQPAGPLTAQRPPVKHAPARRAARTGRVSN
jgi:hypothetical protein